MQSGQGISFSANWTTNAPMSTPQMAASTGAAAPHASGVPPAKVGEWTHVVVAWDRHGSSAFEMWRNGVRGGGLNDGMPNRVPGVTFKEAKSMRGGHAGLQRLYVGGRGLQSPRAAELCWIRECAQVLGVF